MSQDDYSGFKKLLAFILYFLYYYYYSASLSGTNERKFSYHSLVDISWQSFVSDFIQYHGTYIKKCWINECAVKNLINYNSKLTILLQFCHCGQ